MPVTIKRANELSRQSAQPVEPSRPDWVRPHHVRVLSALMPSNPEWPDHEWPAYNRAYLRKLCGFSPTNSMNRILHGTSDAPGLVTGGMIERIDLDIEGVIEANYRITKEGIATCLGQRSD